MVTRPNLQLLNKVRVIAQTVENSNFKREYQCIITPILDKYKDNICNDDEMFFKIHEAIKSINHLADTYMYVPNYPSRENTYSKNPKDYSDHGTLMKVYTFTNEIIKEHNIN